MSDMHTLEGCLELEFTLPKTPQKAISMFMELEEEQAVPHTKTGRVIYVTGEHPALTATNLCPPAVTGAGLGSVVTVELHFRSCRNLSAHCIQSLGATVTPEHMGSR